MFKTHYSAKILYSCWIVVISNFSSFLEASKSSVMVKIKTK